MSSYRERVYPTEPQLTTPEGEREKLLGKPRGTRVMRNQGQGDQGQGNQGQGNQGQGNQGQGNQDPISHEAYSIRNSPVRLRINYQPNPTLLNLADRTDNQKNKEMRL